jgi:hypothetical protein
LKSSRSFERKDVFSFKATRNGLPKPAWLALIQSCTAQGTKLENGLQGQDKQAHSDAG